MRERKRKLVYIADDDEPTRKQIELVLKSRVKNLIIKQFENGDEANRAILKETPHLLITNLLMPIFTGEFFIYLLRGSGMKFPILLISTQHHRLDEIRNSAPESLNIMTMQKPIDNDDLVSMVKYLLGKK